MRRMIAPDLFARKWFDRRCSDLGRRGHARRPDADLVWLPGPCCRGGPSAPLADVPSSPILGLAKLTGSACTVVLTAFGRFSVRLAPGNTVTALPQTTHAASDAPCASGPAP
jgi:hypothetical protein